MDVRTVPDLLNAAVELRRKPDAYLVMREGRWEPVPIAWVAQQVAAMARQIRARGIGKGDRVVVLSESRIEWGLADLAILSVGGVTVPVYATLPANQVAPLLADSGAVGAFVSSAEHKKKLEGARAASPGLRWIHTFDTDPWPGVAPGAVDPTVPVQPDDLATIMYTSGTTGEPKGVMLTHGNIVSEVLLSLQAMELRTSDVYLSLLPMSHVFERLNGFHTMLYAGVRIAYAESLDAVSKNMREVRPTIVMAVPRMYEKILARAEDRATAAGFPSAPLWRWARRVAVAWAAARAEGRAVPATLAIQHALASRLVYRKLIAALGGRTRMHISGGAPLHRDVALFFSGCGLPIFEGYGLTETSSAISVNGFGKHKLGSVGPLLRNVELRFAPDGELMVKGPLVMKGYWQKPDATAAAMEGGWFRTGDIGEMDADGFLRITDRKKDLLVTSGGKKVAPQPIEAALKSTGRIAEALLVGDGQKFIAALIVPTAGIAREQVAAEVERVNGALASFEKIKRFELIPDDLTIENGMMTPSLKLKRKAVIDRHRDLVARFFASGS